MKIIFKKKISFLNRPSEMLFRASTFSATMTYWSYWGNQRKKTSFKSTSKSYSQALTDYKQNKSKSPFQLCQYSVQQMKKFGY